MHHHVSLKVKSDKNGFPSGKFASVIRDFKNKLEPKG